MQQWWRFRDDVLVVMKSNCQQELSSLIKNPAGPVFVVVGDQCSSASVDFFSARFDVSSGGRVSTRRAFRPSAVPLSVSSADPVVVHSRWPTGGGGGGAFEECHVVV